MIIRWTATVILMYFVFRKADLIVAVTIAGLLISNELHQLQIDALRSELLKAVMREHLRNSGCIMSPMKEEIIKQ